MSEAANRQHSASRCTFRSRWSEENSPERVKSCTSARKAREAAIWMAQRLIWFMCSKARGDCCDDRNELYLAMKVSYCVPVF